MSLIRLLLIGAAIWLVLQFLKNWNVRIERREPPPANPEPKEPLTLRACPGCGVRVPARELDNGAGCERCRSASPPR